MINPSTPPPPEKNNVSQARVIFEPCSEVKHFIDYTYAYVLRRASTAVNLCNPGAGDSPVLAQNMEHS